MMQANTGVRFETKDSLLSQLVKQAEEKCRLNIKNFGGDPVLVEGGPRTCCACSSCISFRSLRTP